ncbi:MAG TPA: hypothetical protein VK470_06830, partial [Bacteroidota bacterium]|nr:hypothetical protein [Bacteroidota bacterium]
AHFSQAARYASALSKSQIPFDIAVNHASTLAQLGQKDDAIRQLQIAARTASSLNDTTLLVRLKAVSGAVYLKLGMFENAMSEFMQGLRLDSLSEVPEMDVQLLCGIGEIFYANYAFANAREFFSKAHNHALIHENDAVIGYCLMRMGECEERETLHSPSAPGVMRAVSLYQQAQKVFTRNASPLRTALGRFKEAMLRAALHEDEDAEPLFQSSFELMRTASMQSFCFTEPFILTSESRLLPEGTTCGDWWYRPYASFLMRKRRIGDALAMMATGEASDLKQEFLLYPYAFQDSVRHKAVASYLATVRAAAIAESELMARQNLGTALIDKPDGDTLRSAYPALQKTMIVEGTALVSRYPSLLPIVTQAQPVSFESIRARTPGDGSLLSLLSLDGSLFAVIVPGSAAPMAVNLGASAPLRDRISAYCGLIQRNAVRSAEGQPTEDAVVRQASMQLSSLLIQPVERYLTRTVVVNANEELDGLPVHALILPSGKYASEVHDLTYAPIIYSPGTHIEGPPLKNVVAFGAPSNKSLEAEYELRSIKNFYPDASIVVTQLATERNFRDVSGDVLHLSTLYTRDALTHRSLFALSGGSITTPISFEPISTFLLARPFRFWVIADLRRDSCSTTPLHAMFAMMSGASRCILQRYSCSAATAKEFNGYLYTSILAHGNPKNAYKEALQQLRTAHPASASVLSAPYFMMEW